MTLQLDYRASTDFALRAYRFHPIICIRRAIIRLCRIITREVVRFMPFSIIAVYFSVHIVGFLLNLAIIIPFFEFPW